MTTPLERVRKLLERAVGTHSEEEARTSALIAAKMIKDYGFRVVPANGDVAKPNQPEIPTGYYDVELTSASYDHGPALMDLEFTIEESGKKFLQFYMFRHPLHGMARSFIEASGQNPFDYAAELRGQDLHAVLVKFCLKVVGTKYGVYVEDFPRLGKGRTMIVKYLPYGSAGR